FKGHQLIQPVYGMAAVQAYLAARQAAEDQAARTAVGRERRTDDPTGPDPAASASTAGAAAAAAAAAELARRRAVEAFPTQLGRAAAADGRITTSEAGRTG
ncbi:hypothetical protein ACFVXQ_34875, partial [Kitasatospora sp. NPDC058263]